MDNEQAINIAKVCVMASFMDSGTKQAVIEALSQVAISKTETTSCECEWCDGKEDSLLVWTKDPVEIEWDDREYTTRGWTWKELKPNYCPNCGKPIKGGEDA